VLLALFSQVLSAQIITDSIRTQASYANDVYYSLKNGEVKAVANNEWQLAFQIGMGQLSIRSNAATGSSAIGSVTVFEKPGKDTTQWATFDTTGFTGWTLLNNTDSSWNLGAFNVNNDIANPLDFSWGVYNPVNHYILGTRLYVVVIKTGASSYAYKKLWVINNALGTWNLKYADLDGSNEVVKQIKSSDYTGHNFAYLSMVGDSVFNHEPLSADWDFVLTRYAGLQSVNPAVYYPVTGILTNKGVKTGEVRGINTTLSAITDTTKMSSNISEIGSDWKLFNMQTFSYVTVDSLSYFVKAKDGANWKVVFKGFSSSQGKTTFTKELIPPAMIDSLELNHDTLSFVSGGESKTLELTSNTAWAITGTPSWITITPSTSGNGNASLSFTAAANTTGTVRSADITVTAGVEIRTVHLTQDMATGLAEVKQIRIINAYPNPSNGTFTVQNELNAAATVEVFNLNGVKVDGFALPASQSKSVDYNALPSGIYMLHILSDKGQQNMRLLISK